LHIVEHGGLASLACAFPKAPVIYQDDIIIIPVKIFGIFCPTLNASGIAMKIKDQSQGFFAVKMQTIDTHPRGYVKKKFGERCIVMILKILGQFLRLENEFLLDEIGYDPNGHINSQDQQPVNRKQIETWYQLVG
jgi:hypothetical protein